MDERLTDKEVAAFVNDRWYNALTQANEPTVVARLALEVQERRSQHCETCDGWTRHDDKRGWCEFLDIITHADWHCGSWGRRT